jgi:hypothetical protein
VTNEERVQRLIAAQRKGFENFSLDDYDSECGDSEQDGYDDMNTDLYKSATDKVDELIYFKNVLEEL